MKSLVNQNSKQRVVMLQNVRYPIPKRPAPPPPPSKLRAPPSKAMHKSGAEAASEPPQTANEFMQNLEKIKMAHIVLLNHVEDGVASEAVYKFERALQAICFLLLLCLDAFPSLLCIPLTCITGSAEEKM